MHGSAGFSLLSLYETTRTANRLIPVPLFGDPHPHRWERGGQQRVSNEKETDMRITTLTMVAVLGAAPLVARLGAQTVHTKPAPRTSSGSSGSSGGTVAAVAPAPAVIIVPNNSVYSQYGQYGGGPVFYGNLPIVLTA